ncbi:MAG: 16S rRNA (adenine(1518)-N(6)/adenine(1519)-N(6))-dimethyltransferase RsmA [Bryobacteraceae bacterium]
MSQSKSGERAARHPALGQHFLVRQSILKRIAEAACPERVPLVIEIGPGKGALTEHLLERAERVVAVEIDPAMVGQLMLRFPGERRLKVVAQDILSTDLTQWGPATVAGNIPYYITSPIVERVLAMGKTLERAVLLVQKEVAERLAAKPGSRDYGFLTVATQLVAETKLLFKAPPSAFQPPPKVDSAVVSLAPRPVAADPTPLIAFLGLCFRHKRKTLRNNLAHIFGKELVDSQPEAGLRAEQLTLEQFRDLYRRLTATG